MERQTPGLEPGTAESEGLGVGWGRAAAQMQAAWGGNGGRAGRFHGNGVIHGGDKPGHSQHLAEGSLRSQPVCGRETEDLQTGNASDTGWENEGGVERKKGLPSPA